MSTKWWIIIAVVVLVAIIILYAVKVNADAKAKAAQDALYLGQLGSIAGHTSPGAGSFFHNAFSGLAGIFSGLKLSLYGA